MCGTAVRKCSSTGTRPRDVSPNPAAAGFNSAVLERELRRPRRARADGDQDLLAAQPGGAAGRDRVDDLDGVRVEEATGPVDDGHAVAVEPLADLLGLGRLDHPLVAEQLIDG